MPTNQPASGFDWPSETIVTAAGLGEMIKGLSPEQVRSLQEQANGFRSGTVPDKIDRSYLRFPEVPQPGAGAPDARSLAVPQQPHVASAMRAARAEWFGAILRSPMGMAHLAPNVSEPVRRALAESSGDSGGYAVPIGFLGDLIYDVDPLDQIFPYVRKLPVGVNTGWIPAASVNPSMSWGSENVSIDESDPAFGRVQWLIERMNAFVPISRELCDDSNIVEYVMALFSQCIREERDRVLVIGNGSGQPMGLYSASGIYDTGITTMSYANLLKLKFAIDMRYHALPSCRWVFHQKVLEAILALTDNNDRPLVNFNALAPGAPPTLLGHQYSISNNCPENFAFFGALSYYVWFDRQQVTIEKTIEAGNAFLQHQMWVKFIQRADGKPALPPTCPMARTTVLTGIS